MAGLTSWYERACGLLPELSAATMAALAATPRALRPAAVDVVLRTHPILPLVASETTAELNTCWDGVPLPKPPAETIEMARRWLLLEIVERTEAFRDGPEALGRHFAVSDLRAIDDPLRDGRSVVVANATFGPWRWVGVELARRGYPVVELDLRPPGRRPTMTEPFGPGLDLRHGPTSGYARTLVRWIRERPVVVVATCDEVGGPRKARGTLLGRPATVGSTPFEIARRFNCALVPVFALRHGPRWELAVDEAIKVSRTGRGRGDLDTTATRYLKVLERWARRHPDHYLPQLHIRRSSRYDDTTPLFDDARPAPKGKG